MYRFQPAYPSVQHEQAAQSIVDFFSQKPGVEAILLTCSCARGKASRDSCLDMDVLTRPDWLATHRKDIEQEWNHFYATEPVFRELLQVGKYSHVDLEIANGQFNSGGHGWTSGPDEFELAIGNLLVYSVTLWQQENYLDALKAQWLPYYSETLRQERLAMVRRYCLNNLQHIPGYVERGLYFQAFRRLYNAFGEFLQALFISRRVYPIAYDKWIKEQIAEILELPQLYSELPHLFEIGYFEGHEIADKAVKLEQLLEIYVV